MDTKVCQLEYMDSWKKSEETKLAQYSKLGGCERYQWSSMNMHSKIGIE